MVAVGAPFSGRRFFPRLVVVVRAIMVAPFRQTRGDGGRGDFTVLALPVAQHICLVCSKIFDWA